MTKLEQAAKECADTMRCNCDLDTWEPERVPYTGHTHVCRIHQAAVAKVKADAAAERLAEAWNPPFRYNGD